MAEYIKREDALKAMEWKWAGKAAFYAVKAIPSADVASAQDFRDCRNELCLKCGQYQAKHLGSCNGCRWE